MQQHKIIQKLKGEFRNWNNLKLVVLIKMWAKNMQINSISIILFSFISQPWPCNENILDTSKNFPAGHPCTVICNHYSQTSFNSWSHMHNLQKNKTNKTIFKTMTSNINNIVVFELRFQMFTRSLMLEAGTISNSNQEKV